MSPSPCPASSGIGTSRSIAEGTGADWFDRPGSIVFIAGLMGLLSLAVDLCVPALPSIAREFDLADVGAVHSLITLFLLSFGAGHLFQGFLTDRFGRKPVLLTNLVLYIAMAMVCALASSFELLLLARAVQGAAAAGCRVAATAVLRDVKDGAELARSMSLAMMIFSAIPIVAPILGQALVVFVDYRAVFLLVALVPAGLFAIAALRLPETWPPECRVPIRARVIAESSLQLARSRDTLGYSVIGGILYGLMFGFLALAPRIYGNIFALPVLFPLLVSMAALAMGVAAFLNARVVRAMGARRVVFVALCIVASASAGLCLFAYSGLLNAATFQLLILVTMFGMGLAFANCNVLAIQPHGKIAGLASSMVGGATMIVSAILSHAIGLTFDGTVVPLGVMFLGFALLP